MKETIKIKLLLVGLMVVFIAACATAQNHFDTNINKTARELRILEKKSIILDMELRVNGKEIHDSTYIVEVVDLSTGVLTSFKLENSFKLYLEYNRIFEISFTYANKTSTKVITVDTHSPHENWYIITGVDLETKHKGNRYLVGSLTFDERLKTFVKKKA